MLQKHKSLAENLDEKAFLMIKDAIFKATGLKCEYYRDNYLRRRISSRMRTLGIDSYWRYLRYLRSHSDEYSLLLRDLTINYTKFFRDPDVFIFFKDVILPSILSSKNTIRVLSAGCASGEEPYTIGMMIYEALGSKISDFYISIHGVDIDEDCIKKATTGLYDEKELSNIPSYLIKKYFDFVGGGLFKVKNMIRRFIHFERADIISGLKYRSFDVIFCRNVLIYFDKRGQAQLFNNFYNSLTVDGYLILGKTEVIPEEAQGMFRCISPEARVYQKVWPLR
ncbi:MAG: protein-glutamate O-methyltransferase CheR [Candidatus Bathyarchaeia archaeon]